MEKNPDFKITKRLETVTYSSENIELCWEYEQANETSCYRKGCHNETCMASITNNKVLCRL